MLSDDAKKLLLAMQLNIYRKYSITIRTDMIQTDLMQLEL